MAPTGVHGLIGLAVAFLLARKWVASDGRDSTTRLKSPESHASHGLLRPFRSPGAKVGVVWGNVAPDMDLLAAPLVFAITQSEKATASIHRTWTHSLLVIGAIALLALLLRARKHRAAPFAGGVALGMGLHDLADVFYIAGVPLFYPLSTQEYWVVPPLYTSAMDFMGEAAFYLAVFFLIRGEKTVWRKVLPLAAGANIAIYSYFAWLSTQGLPLNKFTFLAYLPGLVFLALSTTLPLWVRGTVGRLGQPKQATS